MSYPTIIGNGLNSGVTLSQIHQGNASFRKDTSTKQHAVTECILRWQAIRFASPVKPPST